MISKWMTKYCCEYISLIENYDKAINDNENTWVCHHKLEIELDKTNKELKESNLYYNRPASELIFLTPKEHNHLHHYGKHYSLGKCGKRGKENHIKEKKIVYKSKEKKKYIKPMMLIRNKTFNKEYTYWSKEDIMISYLKFRNII